MRTLKLTLAVALAAVAAQAFPPPPMGEKTDPAAGEGRRSWSEVVAEVERTMLLCGRNEYGVFNDMGTLDLGGTLTPQEERAQLVVWSAMSSPLRWIGDRAKLPEPIRALLDNRDFLNVDQDVVARQAYPVTRQNGAVVLLKDCWGLNCNMKVVTFFNPTDVAATVTLDFADAELAGEVKVNDVIDGQPSRTLTGSMTETVPPHGVKLYRCFGKTALMRRRYDIGSAVIGAQGDDVQFRHVYAPSNGVYRLTVEATGVYDLQVNGLAYGKGLKDLSETAVPLCLSENFIRLVRVNGADVKAISIK